MDAVSPSLPFKSLPGPSAWRCLGNPAIGEINVPKYGSVTYGEWVRYYDGLAAIEQDAELTQEQRSARVRGLQAGLILRRVEPAWQIDQMGEPWLTRSEQGELSPVSVSDLLVTELSKFFLGELNRWMPSGYVMLVEHESADTAQKIAIAEAEREGLVVLTRADLRLSGMFALFHRRSQPQGGTPVWEVVADYSRDEEFSETEAEAQTAESGGKK